MRPFYFVRTQEKVEYALLDMFNNLIVNKYANLSRTDIVKTLHVPIVTHYDKNFANWYRNADHKKRPMSLPTGGLRYIGKTENSANRTQTTYCRNIFSRATDQWLQDIQPTPYILHYELQFLMDNKSDFGQINENITPYFNTFRTLRIKEWDFAPDIERKIPVVIESISDEFEDELEAGSKPRLIKTTYKLKLEVDWYRPMEIPAIIKYAELNFEIGEFLHKTQILVYPDPIAEETKKKWETLTPSIKKGYSLLTTCAGTCIKEADLEGNITWEDITTPDAIRPVQVPDFRLLSLDFDDDTDVATDESGFGRDFVAVDDRTFIPDLEPGAGQEVTDGYKVEDTVVWDKIFNWFGTNNGENENPFTFSIKLKFNDDPPPDTIFQYLANDETTDANGNTIPAGEVFFDWGLMDSKLYFSFKTYGSNALSYTFTTEKQSTLNNTDLYNFRFVLYDNGHEGIFGYATNDGSTVALSTEKD